MHPERVARKHGGRPVVVGEDGVGPVQVGRHHKLELVAAAEVDFVAVLYLAARKVKVDEVLQELEADLGAQHGRVGGRLEH
eukprot:scaffold86762_cov22-Prasinocladus_malaysianus.AAC.1